MRPIQRCWHARLWVLSIAALAAACGGERGGEEAYPLDAVLRLNHVQVLGTHNSYHVRPSRAAVAEWQYTHLPLDEQFATQGIRQIELDVFADPDGGLYANPIGARGEEFHLPQLSLPGFKVLHVQDVDFRSNCWTFVECLAVVRQWSDAHPRHVPLMILVEAKDDALFPGLTVPVPIGAAELDLLEQEILSVFPIERIITPDEVRGGHSTLAEAVTSTGWPTLAETRGRVLFALDNGGRVKAAYLAGHPSLQGRILFTDSAPGAPEAAFVKRNDPLENEEEIRALVAAGFIVRTRADADTQEARTGDTGRREAALASGAQFVSTDYPVPDPAFGTGYFVAIPGGTPARCNPVSAPPECTPLDIENPAFLQ